MSPSKIYKGTNNMTAVTGTMSAYFANKEMAYKFQGREELDTRIVKKDSPDALELKLRGYELDTKQPTPKTESWTLWSDAPLDRKAEITFRKY